VRARVCVGDIGFNKMVLQFIFIMMLGLS